MRKLTNKLVQKVKEKILKKSLEMARIKCENDALKCENDALRAAAIKSEEIDPAYSNIPDAHFYRQFISEAPFYLPWLDKKKFSDFKKIALKKTLVSTERLYVIYALLRQSLNIEGEIWECGVYKGGTAAMMASIMSFNSSNKKLFLFDTFQGMPETDKDKDLHLAGDFNDTSLGEVKEYVGHVSMCCYREGYIPQTFIGLEGEKIAFAHIDVDIFQSVIDCMNFIWPRLSMGGIMLFDDYGFQSCPGARAAVDTFFHDKRSTPLILPTGQAVVFKNVS